MPKLVKTTPDGVLIADNFVYGPGYTLFVADAPPPTQGWVYYAADVTLADFTLPWKQPSGATDAYALGALVSKDGIIWRSTVLANVWAPGVSGWINASTDFPAWIQPTGAHDAYQLDAVVAHNSKRWRSLIAANVWAPGVTGWREAVLTPPDAAPVYPAWVQPLGEGDAYTLDAFVTHAGQTWKNTGSNANVWEPGVFGWTLTEP